MSLTKRVEVLFDPEQYKLVERIARSRGETVGALVRRAVEQQYLGPTLEERKAAVHRLISQEIDFGSWEEIKAELERAKVREIEAS